MEELWLEPKNDANALVLWVGEVHMAIILDIFGWLDLGGVTGFLRVETRMLQTSYIQCSSLQWNYPAPNVNSATIEKPCTKDQAFHFCILHFFFSLHNPDSFLLPFWCHSEDRLQRRLSRFPQMMPDVGSGSIQKYNSVRNWNQDWAWVLKDSVSVRNFSYELGMLDPQRWRLLTNCLEVQEWVKPLRSRWILRQLIVHSPGSGISCIQVGVWCICKELWLTHPQIASGEPQ